MSNEVYIDGCNVAECKHFDDGDCLNPALTVLSCEAETNCLYKQLQRAKAENEKLKKEVETWSYQAEKRDEIGDVWYDTALKYKQALNKVKNYCMTKDEFIYCADSDFYAKRAKDILNIINEGLN